MSRWIDNFDNYAFKITWEDLKNKLDEATIDETVVLNIEELARLKKVVTFVDNALESIDPELISLTLLNSFNTAATATRQEILNYNSNKNIAHLQSANNKLDILLDSVRPYIIYGDKLKKSLLAAIRAYTSEVNKHLEHIVDTEAEYKKAQNFREEIEEYYDVLFDDGEDNESIKLQIATLLENTEAEHEEINKFYNEILNDDENESIKTTVEEAKKDILRDTEEANEKLVNVSSKIDNLDKFYIKVFGFEDEEGNITGGLDKELKLRIKELDDFKNVQEVKYEDILTKKLNSITTYEKNQQANNKNLYEQIESLLPGATSAGLAKAYQLMKDSFEQAIKNWNQVFVGSVIVMFIATFLSFIEIGIVKDNVITWFSFAKMGDITSTMNSLLFKLPLYAPLIWLAIFATKRRSENQRLQQEYAHKEAVATSYISYKMQIDELGTEDKELLKKLLNSSIDTVSHNASESLDKKHGDATPAQETIKMFVEQVTKLTAK